MPKALPNPSGPVFTLSDDFLASALQASHQSERRRIIQPIQRNQESKVQRLLNYLQPGTYIRPHCHPQPHATESVCLLSGSLEVLIFTPEGQITSRHLLSPKSPLIDLEPGVWHGMIVKEADTVIFEVKQGPYEPMNDKDFASWAPPEDSPQVADYLASLQ